LRFSSVIQVDQLQNEFVRMQRLNFVLLKNFARKVLQIHRDDHLSLPELLSPGLELQFAATGNRPAFLRDEPFVIFPKS